MTRISFLIALMSILFSCKDQPRDQIDISGITMDVKIERFEEKFYQSGEQELAELKKEYPYLFPVENHDSIWRQKMNDPEELELFKLSQQVFGDFSEEKEQLTNLFKHVKYDYKKFTAPKVITLITNLDYENKVFYADSLLFISVDMYLGEDSEVYRDFPKYLLHNYKRSHLMVDVAKEIVKGLVLTKGKGRLFLDKMISDGKMMYLLDRYLPELSEMEKIGYTQDHWRWAIENEKEIWKYFVEQELLYSTDPNLSSRFIKEAPFSKFYKQSDNDSPGKIGVWIGWQIVNSYMKYNDVTLQQLLALDAEEIFKKSKYKPKR